MTSLRLTPLALLVLLPAAVAQMAQPRPPSTPVVVSDPGAPRAISPAQITAIRSVSRNVLTAKKSGIDNSVDAEQLSRLRATLDQLLAADLDSGNRMAITVQVPGNGQPRAAAPANAALRDAARLDARAVAAQLRSHSAMQASRAQATSGAGNESAGFPIGEQRARLFERWTQKLDTALADNNPEGPAQLRELRAQLQAKKGSLGDAPLTHGTPTLQAMPAGFQPPRNNDASARP